MHCDKAEKLIVSYLENTLSHEQSLQLATHLHDCPDCLRYMNELRQLQYLMSSLEDEELPSGFQERLIGRLQQTFPEEQKKPEAHDIQKLQTRYRLRDVTRNTIIKWAAGLAAVFALTLSLRFIPLFGNTSPARFDDSKALTLDPDEPKMESAYDEELSRIQNDNTGTRGTQPEKSYNEGLLDGNVDADAEIPVTIYLYIGNEGEAESKVEEIVAAAESVQMLVTEKQTNKVVLQIPDGNEEQLTAFFLELSDLGRLESENVTKDSNTLTIFIMTSN
ncbi:MAG: zf-HC2 domain-containing protein [Clostridia bacterium]|nr:zf-HC2 domain-containing protein [Clostridia bacterium]